MVTATRPPQLSQVGALAIAARDGDQRTYAKAVHNYEYEFYQDAWAHGLETLNEVVIVCPPDTYKSTTVRHFVERAIGRNPDIRILWIMNAGDQAMKNVMAVRQTIEGNNVYRQAFGIAEDKDSQWTNSVLFVKRDYKGPDPTLMGAGINGPYQGLHFDIVILDDLTDQEDPRSPTTMLAQEEKLRGVIIDRVLEGGRIIGICTRWGETDLVPTFADMGFTIVEMPIVGDYPWGPTLSPTRFPPERVEIIRQKKGDVLFAMTFMCNPQAVGGNLISREHIGYWEKDTFPTKSMPFFMGIDPSASLKTYADHSAIATVGIDWKTRVMYLVDMWCKRVETPDLESQIVRKFRRMGAIRRIGLETKGFQLSLLQGMRRRYRLPFKEIPYRTRRTQMQKVIAVDNDKVGRALYLDSLFSSGRLLIPRGLPLVEGISLESELCTIPNGKMDDRMDALAFACVLAEGAMPMSLKVRIRGF